MTLQDFKIGTTLGGITNLESLSPAVRPPRSTFKPAAEQRKLASGLVRGLGWPVATWTWDVISRAERDKLRTFCTTTSATVYIRTKQMDSDTYANYKAVMVWPTDSEERAADSRVNFTITFQALEVQT